ncbi:uncharacterized protein LAESUDRAFT_732556 [Laetiporus sulphureus 93-53]|uniref:Uncharacterized protein n=1 Tax=Laetiporus sulphureus 93-53 TaxID=1314785 RepID=A0A165B3U2_9APHY|nr:uncharacterized protein LAESUDRAFT_732556 [Laetiporus sulphureus 93-53]KZT00172.1 hypothetical protein LAESUDRAFT_732556 [Laetiporus sulphureus 93-53]
MGQAKKTICKERGFSNSMHSTSNRAHLHFCTLGDFGVGRRHSVHPSNRNFIRNSKKSRVACGTSLTTK